MPRVKPLTPITDYSRLGRENLKRARKAKGLTQQQVADRLNISLRYYQNLEEGTRTGNFDIWDRLEDITGVHQRVLREIANIHHVLKANP